MDPRRQHHCADLVFSGSTVAGYSESCEPGLSRFVAAKAHFILRSRQITQELPELSGFVEDMHASGRKPTARVSDQEIVNPMQPWRVNSTLTKARRVVRIVACRMEDRYSPLLR